LAPLLQDVEEGERRDDNNRGHEEDDGDDTSVPWGAAADRMDKWVPSRYGYWATPQPATTDPTAVTASTRTPRRESDPKDSKDSKAVRPATDDTATPWAR
jgi:hypothetical protein